MSKALDELTGTDLEERDEPWQTAERAPRPLAGETVEERRARLVAPRDVGSRGWRLTVIGLAVAFLLAAAAWFGLVPGASAVHRYPPWRLQELADRMNEAESCGADGEVVVDHIRGRVVLGAVDPKVALSDEERWMVDGLDGAEYLVFCPQLGTG